MRRTEDIRFAQLDAQRAAEDAEKRLRLQGPPVEVIEGEEIVFEVHRPRENFSLEPGLNPFQPGYNPGQKTKKDEDKENHNPLSKLPMPAPPSGLTTTTTTPCRISPRLDDPQRLRRSIRGRRGRFGTPLQNQIVPQVVPRPVPQPAPVKPRFRPRAANFQTVPPVPPPPNEECGPESNRHGLHRAVWEYSHPDRRKDQIPAPNQLTSEAMIEFRVYDDPYSSENQYKRGDSLHLHLAAAINHYRSAKVSRSSRDCKKEKGLKAVSTNHAALVKYASDDTLRTMEDSLIRKNEIYSKVDPYALQGAQTEEEERFMEKSGELKEQHNRLGHTFDSHNIDRKNTIKIATIFQQLYPHHSSRVCGNTLYVNLYPHQQIVQCFQLAPIPMHVIDGTRDHHGRLVDTEEHFRIKRGNFSAGRQFNLHTYMDCCSGADRTSPLQLTEREIERDETLFPAARVPSFEETYITELNQDSVAPANIMRLMKELKALIVTQRDQNNVSKEMEQQILGGIGLGLPDVIDAMKANVVFAEMDDITRAAVLGMYFGLSMGLERNGGGLNLKMPFQETDLY